VAKLHFQLKLAALSTVSTPMVRNLRIFELMKHFHRLKNKRRMIDCGKEIDVSYSPKNLPVSGLTNGGGKMVTLSRIKANL
jgi:hypothetical protein